ncbi:E3 ubiquitin-protein ligase SDIR1 isoform X2 [Phalaenopsis equestris]|nr:E3 ubiquitin-protein ligase SDIR1 isoform X2 [Phalaenopsis equestris]
MRMQPGVRPANSNSMVFLITVILLFLILNSHQMSPNFLLWLVLGIFLMATALRMYATCQQLQAQAHAMAASGLLGHTELRLHFPSSIALSNRGRLESLRLQLSLLDRDFDDLDYDALRALDADSPEIPSMSDEEINALPVHKYKGKSRQGSASSRHSFVSIDGTSQQKSSSSLGSSSEKKQENSKADGTMRNSDDELTCSVCLEQVVAGELIRSLPCLHQFHASCIDPWLRQQGTCPVCKHRAGGVGHNGSSGGTDAGEMDASSLV